MYIYVCLYVYYIYTNTYIGRADSLNVAGWFFVVCFRWAVDVEWAVDVDVDEP